jgi:basic membrane protein A
VRIVELERDTQEAVLRTLAGEGHNLVIALGQEYIEPLQIVAPEFPDQHFAIIDAQVDLPNVTSVTFSELEGDFLAGALAALLSESGTVGFLGGADIEIIRRIEDGWSQGVRYINPDATILSEYAGGVDDFSGFAKPELGMELSTEMYNAGADVVYAAAGRTALGAIDAAVREEGIVITTGSDQRYLNPDVVATSRTKNMDVAVYTILSELQRGELAPGNRVLDLASNGVGLAELGDPLVPPDIAAQIETIRQELADGTITVEPYTTE